MKTPEHYTSSHRGRYHTETVYYYRGTADLFHPSPDRPGSTSVEHVECSHRHTNPEAAEKCGYRLGRREAARRNREDATVLKSRACELRSYLFDRAGAIDGGELWIRYCASHFNSGNRLHPTETDADADTWTCPWAVARKESP